MSARRQTAPRTRRPHDSLATREALMQAGLELFAEHGFEGTSVEQIAEQAGANKASINYHFGGKAELYGEILKSTFGSMSGALAALRTKDLPPEQALSAFVGLLGGMMTKRPSLPRMILREVLSGGKHMPKDVLPHFGTLFSTVSGILERGARARRLRKVDPFLTHLSLVGALSFFFATHSFRQRKLAELELPIPKDPKAEDYVAHLQELFVRGLLAAPAGPRAGR